MFDDGRNLIRSIEELWNGEQKDEVRKKLDGWLRACIEGKDKIQKAKKQFHQWYPLRVYVSVGKTKSNFSLRFFGQEVAELVVKANNEVKIRLSKNNQKYFENMTLKEGEYSWNNAEAKMFRKFFKDLADNSREKPNLRSEEHRIESKFIDEMLKGKGKFGLTDFEIQPVMLGGCPLQFPVPFSANTGKVKKGPGHIDILARHKGRDNKVRLSIWELKRPKEYGHASYQAYIYAVQLLKILRSENGKEWYRVFGFNGVLPKSLEVEVVVAMDHKHKDKHKDRFNEDEKKLGKNNKINGDVIKLYPAYYEDTNGGIRLVEDSFQEDI